MVASSATHGIKVRRGEGKVYVGAPVNACTQNGASTAFPWAASKRIGNDEDAGCRRNAWFSKVASATTAPMHFQLLESDVLLELLERNYF